MSKGGALGTLGDKHRRDQRGPYVFHPGQHGHARDDHRVDEGTSDVGADNSRSPRPACGPFAHEAILSG